MTDKKVIRHLFFITALLLLGTLSFVPLLVVARASGWDYEGGRLLSLALLVVAVPAYLLTLSLWRRDSLDGRFLKLVATLWLLLGTLSLAVSLWLPAALYLAVCVWMFIISTMVKPDPLGIRK